MIKLYKAAKKANTTSEAVKVKIDNGEISYELRSGIYYVDENEVKRKMKNTHTNNVLIKMDDEMKYILKVTLNDFKNTNLNVTNIYMGSNGEMKVGKVNGNSLSQTINLLQKVLNDGCITDMKIFSDLTEYYSKQFFDVYNEIPNEFFKWFDITTPSKFYQLRSKYFNSEYDRWLSLPLEHFYMFNKLTDGGIPFINKATIELQKIKESNISKKVA